jgi:hypothetical protein
MNRRQLLKQSAAAVAGMIGAPYVIAQEKTQPDFQGVEIGHRGHRYRVDLAWCKADRAKYPVNDCHEMVQVADGRLFLLTNHAQNNVLILDTAGAVQGAWTLGFKGAHGLTLHRDAGGVEHLWITDTATSRVVRTTLEGKVEQELPHASKCGAYDDKTQYVPTETAIGPNGDIYVADGYGSQFILRFDSAGKFLGKFGGRSTLPSNAGKFMQAHGVAIDARGPESLLLCTERIRNEFHWYTLDGKFVRSLYLPGAYISRPVIAGKELYTGVCFGMFEDDYRMWVNRGFVLVIDDKGKVVSAPGGKQPEYRKDRLQLLLQDQPIFKNCHDVCVDSKSDLYVCQWNAGKVYPYKLTRI